MVRLCTYGLALLAMLVLGMGTGAAQEVLLPLGDVYRPSQQAQHKSGPVGLPFFDDFSAYEGAPSAALWSPGGGYVGKGFALLPPTTGMLTLDVLDASGNIYPHATSSLFGADTVMSQPIALDTLSPADSVMLSFYYLPGGGSGNLWERIGDTPEHYDSLLLDFYCPSDSVWRTVWSTGCISEDSLLSQTGRDWQYVAVALDDGIYFDSSFRFRFRNYASLDASAKPGMTGNCDQWNIDYVFMDRNRTVMGSPVFRDVAFTGAAPSMLASYRAMPASQYRQDDMAQSLQLHITNLYSSALASHYSYSVLDDGGNTLYSYDGGLENAPSFLPSGSYQTAAAHSTPAVGFSFPEGPEERSYTICHVVREGTGGDSHQDNDTLRYVQHFGNYFAYDDGSAENGYGLTSTASRLYLAYRFDLNVQDTLTAVDISFNRTYGDENASVPFYITVWQRADDGRPGEVLYRDGTRYKPQFGTTSPFHRYVLEQPVVVSGSVFVGIEQENNTFINIGFDRGYNTAERIYYLTGTEWQQSILSGSLMLRPCFGSAAALAIEQPEPATRKVTLYPNPASNMVTVEPMENGSVARLYDMHGRLLQTSTTGRMELHYTAGFYFIIVTSPERNTSIHKLIIRN